MQNTSDILINKLNQFIRRYYQNQLLKGILYSIFFILSGFLIVNALEYVGYFNSAIRAILFWTCLTIAAFIILYYIIIPMTKIMRLGKTISYQQAATIIGDHFPDIQDKLLNLLQLKEQLLQNESDLLEASIQQKTDQLSPIPFIKAIDLKKNRKYIKYTLIPVILLFLALILSPSFIMDSSKRIVNYSTVFEKPAPFAFEIQNKNLKVPQQDHFLLEVKVVGSMLPNEVYINANGIRSKMKKVSKLDYTYEFKNVNQDVHFSFESGKVNSKQYTLSILPKPVLVNFKVKITNPVYTQKPTELYENTGDLIVTQGATVEWTFQTKDAAFLAVWFADETKQLIPDNSNQIIISKRIIQPLPYGFFVGNHFIPSTDSMYFSLSVLEDMLPAIAVMEYKDTLVADKVFFRGELKDDYGFSKLKFILLRRNQKKAEEIVIEQELPLKSHETAQEFDYSFDLTSIHTEAGDEIIYYFEVWDNDGFSGPKSAVSQRFYYKILSSDEVEKITEKTAAEIKDETDKSMSEIKKVQQEIKDLMKKLVDKKELNWQDQKQLQELAEKQKSIKQSLEQIQEKIKQNHLLEEQYKKIDESLIEKQKELEKLFEKLINEELKEMMAEIERMLNAIDKDQVKSALDNIKMNNESIEKQLDRNIELLKNLEIEKQLDEIIEKISDLGKDQIQLHEITKESKKEGLKSVEEEQKKLNEEYQSIKNQLNDLEKKMNSLAEPKSFKRNKELEKQIEEKQKEASERLQKNDKENAAKKQKEAGDAAEKLSEELNAMKEEMEMEELGEDIERIRQLLKNLVTLSFEQEGLIDKLNATYVQDPNYQNIINSQNKFKEDFKMIEDTLSAIAKRQIKVSSVINKEVSAINMNLAQTMDHLLKLNQSFYGTLKNRYASTYMQYTMTSMNNLALILAESLDNMQNQVRSNKQKSGNPNKNCSNPSSGSTGKKKSKSMKELQEELNEGLGKMREALEKDKNKGQPRKVGEGREMSEELARMAAQQEYIRKMLQEYGEELKDQAGGAQSGEIHSLLKEMEQNETDIVNKTISQQTLQRQQRIVSRLLEHEKSDLKREQEERRESNEGRDIYKKAILDSLYLKKKNQAGYQEMIKWETPVFTPYYKNKINDYFYNVK